MFVHEHPHPPWQHVDQHTIQHHLDYTPYRLHVQNIPVGCAKDASSRFTHDQQDLVAKECSEIVPKPAGLRCACFLGDLSAAGL